LKVTIKEKDSFERERERERACVILGRLGFGNA
jgi:hypothetical protein